MHARTPTPLFFVRTLHATHSFHAFRVSHYAHGFTHADTGLRIYTLTRTTGLRNDSFYTPSRHTRFAPLRACRFHAYHCRFEHVWFTTLPPLRSLVVSGLFSSHFRTVLTHVLRFSSRAFTLFGFAPRAPACGFTTRVGCRAVLRATTFVCVRFRTRPSLGRCGSPGLFTWTSPPRLSRTWTHATTPATPHICRRFRSTLHIQVSRTHSHGFLHRLRFAFSVSTHAVRTHTRSIPLPAYTRTHACDAPPLNAHVLHRFYAAHLTCSSHTWIRAVLAWLRCHTRCVPLLTGCLPLPTRWFRTYRASPRLVHILPRPHAPRAPTHQHTDAHFLHTLRFTYLLFTSPHAHATATVSTPTVCTYFAFVPLTRAWVRGPAFRALHTKSALLHGHAHFTPHCLRFTGGFSLIFIKHHCDAFAPYHTGACGCRTRGFLTLPGFAFTHTHLDAFVAHTPHTFWFAHAVAHHAGLPGCLAHTHLPHTRSPFAGLPFATFSHRTCLSVAAPAVLHRAAHYTTHLVCCVARHVYGSRIATRHCFCRLSRFLDFFPRLFHAHFAAAHAPFSISLLFWFVSTFATHRYSPVAGSAGLPHGHFATHCVCHSAFTACPVLCRFPAHYAPCTPRRFCRLRCPAFRTFLRTRRTRFTGLRTLRTAARTRFGSTLCYRFTQFVATCAVSHHTLRFALRFVRARVYTLTTFRLDSLPHIATFALLPHIPLRYLRFIYAIATTAHLVYMDTTVYIHTFYIFTPLHHSLRTAPFLPHGSGWVTALVTLWFTRFRPRLTAHQPIRFAHRTTFRSAVLPFHRRTVARFLYTLRTHTCIAFSRRSVLDVLPHRFLYAHTCRGLPPHGLYSVCTPLLHARWVPFARGFARTPRFRAAHFADRAP